MGVYNFKMWGRKFLVDVESGNFFEADDTVLEAAVFIDKHNENDLPAYLAKRHGAKRSGGIIRNLSLLKRNGMLFSKEQKNCPQAKRKITDLTLNIVNNCNLRCRYCWNKAGAYGTNKSYRKMTPGIAFKAIKLLMEESKGTRDLVVDFYGGEPLLNYDLIRQVISHCAEIKKKNKIGFRFLLATNGTLLDKEKAEFMIENGVDIAVSIDGAKRIQDTQRPFPDGKGSFDAIMANLDSLKEGYRQRMVGRATFTPYSTRLISTFKFLRSLGFNRIEVCESEKAGYGLNAKSKFFFNADTGVKRLKELYYKLALFYTGEVLSGNLTYENTYFNRFFKQLSRLYHIQSVEGTCSAGFSLMAADIDGSIYPCTAFVGLPDFRIGHADSGIDKSRLERFSDTKISSSSACLDCWAKRLCRGCGSCYNLNYFSYHNPGQPDPYYCELFRYKTKLMMAMIAAIGRKDGRLLDRVLVPEYYATRGRKQK